jgi:hypothetical protein
MPDYAVSNQVISTSSYPNEHIIYIPGLQGSHLVVLTGEHDNQVPQQPLAVLKDEGSYEVQAEEDHMEEEREVGRPVNILEGDHKLREKDQCKITPV